MKPNALHSPGRRIEAVVVGASAGGIEALLADRKSVV